MTDGRRDPKRQDQLRFLFRKQGGRCHICKEPAVLDFAGGAVDHDLSAVRFRLGSSFGRKGRFRPRVMAHRKCADERAAQIENSIPIEELWARSKKLPGGFLFDPGAED